MRWRKIPQRAAPDCMPPNVFDAPTERKMPLRREGPLARQFARPDRQVSPKARTRQPLSESGDGRPGNTHTTFAATSQLTSQQHRDRYAARAEATSTTRVSSRAQRSMSFTPQHTDMGAPSPNNISNGHREEVLIGTASFGRQVPAALMVGRKHDAARQRVKLPATSPI